MSLERLTAWNEFLTRATRPNSKDRASYARFWRFKRRREELLQELHELTAEELLLREAIASVRLAFSALKSMYAHLDEVWVLKKAALTHLGAASEHLLNHQDKLQIRIEEVANKKSNILQSSEYFPPGWPPEG